jgi:hypothetical protein
MSEESYGKPIYAFTVRARDSSTYPITPGMGGKSYANALARDAAIAAGKRVAIHTIGADGEPHVCVVQSIRRGGQNKNVVAPCDEIPSHRDPPGEA